MTQSFYVQAEAATDSIRTAEFGGGEYLVVPVIALVEGVLHSANAENPELALAEEFGRFPNAWDGRPLVMNHPKVNDNYVSANSPTVLEDWSFGQLFNTRVEDGKLKTEAWINLARVAEMGGEVSETIGRIQAGEVVEVSTGLFSSVEANPGEYQGISYAGIWRGIAPDHLAFLSEGTIGACSVADGAGVPRLNMRRPAIKTAQSGDTSMERTETDRLDKANSALASIIANSFPADMPIENVKMHLSDALDAELRTNGDGLYHIYTCTQDTVVYETWNSCEKFSRSFTVSDSTVTLGDDVQEVHLMTSIVPKMNSEADAEEAGDEPINSSEGDETMSDENEAVETPEAAAETETVVETPETEIEDPVVNEAPASVEDYIAAAPAEMRDMLSAGMKLHNDRRATLIGEIKANDANKFGDDVLNSMDMPTLESIHALAASQKPPADYSGQAGGPRANGASDDQTGVPAVLEAFPRKTA